MKPLHMRLRKNSSICCLSVITYVIQGILGSVQSGKSALVHRYLTGSYMQEESPEGNIYIMKYEEKL